MLYEPLTLALLRHEGIPLTCLVQGQHFIGIDLGLSEQHVSEAQVQVWHDLNNDTYRFDTGEVLDEDNYLNLYMDLEPSLELQIDAFDDDDSYCDELEDSTDDVLVFHGALAGMIEFFQERVIDMHLVDELFSKIAQGHPSAVVAGKLQVTLNSLED